MNCVPQTSACLPPPNSWPGVIQWLMLKQVDGRFLSNLQRTLLGRQYGGKAGPPPLLPPGAEQTSGDLRAERESRGGWESATEGCRKMGGSFSRRHVVPALGASVLGESGGCPCSLGPERHMCLHIQGKLKSIYCQPF